MEETRSNWSSDSDDSKVGVPGLLLLHTTDRALWGASTVLTDPAGVELGRGLTLDHPSPLEDSRMSRKHAHVKMVSAARAEVRDLGSRNGTFVNGDRIDKAVIGPGDVLRVGGSFFQLIPNLAHLAERAISDEVSEELRGISPEICVLRAKLRALASNPADVLILGPAGAGKERCAAALHRKSRARGQLVALNCAGITPELAASELFGHVRGAFTGANAQRDGAFKRADRGTLFLDEVGDLPLAIQASLLRTLQERKVLPVGSDRELRFEARVITATNRDITQMVLEDRFRGDLYSRIAGSVLRVPPLSERPADVAQLAEHFLGEERQLHPSAVEALLDHTWVHNVRDLAAVIQLLAAEEGPIVKLNAMAEEKMREDMALAVTLPQSPIATAEPASPAPTVEWPSSDAERVALLERLLEEHDGNITRVATAIGKRGTSVRRWMGQYNIDAERFRR